MVDGKTQVRRWCQDRPEVFAKLEAYAQLVLEYNQQINLTGFDEPKLWTEGIYQSIALLRPFLAAAGGGRLLDIGAGAGFPSVPYLIYHGPTLKLTIIEANQKRLRFLDLVAKRLGLAIELIHGRAETTKPNHHFDWITARAVTSLKNLLEISVHLGGPGTTYFFLKSRHWATELAAAQTLATTLKLGPLQVQPQQLGDGREHVVIWYQKNQPTPTGYPRPWGIIKRQRD